MTKRLTLAALCAVAALVLGGVATAEARGLTQHAAKRIAKRLAATQVRDRNVISFHLHRAVRVSSSRILIGYDDRTADDIFCTATISVTQRTRRKADGGTHTTRRATFTGQSCNAIPDEVLAFEAATRRAQRAVRANSDEVETALTSWEENASRCDKLFGRVPRSRRDEVELLFGISAYQVIERPNDEVLAAFSRELTALDATNTTLAAGAAGWADYLAASAELPVIDDPCADLRDWARSQYVSGAAPIDFAAARATDKRSVAADRAITRAARLMGRRGAFRSAVFAFTPAGLLAEAFPDVQGFTVTDEVVAKRLLR
jgi:hypothetical protein